MAKVVKEWMMMVSVIVEVMQCLVIRSRWSEEPRVVQKLSMGIRLGALVMSVRGL